jgi:hypothetical protein
MFRVQITVAIRVVANKLPVIASGLSDLKKRLGSYKVKLLFFLQYWGLTQGLHLEPLCQPFL